MAPSSRSCCLCGGSCNALHLQCCIRTPQIIALYTLGLRRARQIALIFQLISYVRNVESDFAQTRKPTIIFHSLKRQQHAHCATCRMWKKLICSNFKFFHIVFLAKIRKVWETIQVIKFHLRRLLHHFNVTAWVYIFLGSMAWVHSNIIYVYIEMSRSIPTSWVYKTGRVSKGNIYIRPTLSAGR